MIFMENPIAGFSAGLGAATPNTTRLRQALITLAQIKNDKNYSPCSPIVTTCSASCDVDQEVLFGLFYAAGKLGKNVPGVSDLLAKIESGLGAIPFVGFFLRAIFESRLLMAAGWEALPGETKVDILNWLRQNAGTLATVVEKANAFLGPAAPALPAELTPEMRALIIAQQAPVAFIRAGQFPPGAVAVRDPIANTFRILAPPLK